MRTIGRIHASGTLLSLVAALSLGAATGCETGATDEAATQAAAVTLDEEHGGLSTDDEAPSFGAREGAGRMEPGALRPEARDEAPRGDAAADGSATYRVVALWGHFPRPDRARPRRGDPTREGDEASPRPAPSAEGEAGMRPPPPPPHGGSAPEDHDGMRPPPPDGSAPPALADGGTPPPPPPPRGDGGLPALADGARPTSGGDDEAARRAAATRWSGHIAVEGARLAVLRTMQFEGDDRVLPRTAADRVSFETRTLPFVDGVTLLVRARPGAVLRFESEAARASIALPELRGEPVFTPAGAPHVGVLLLAQRVRPGCDSGVVVGEWRRPEGEDRAGSLRGRMFEGDRAAPDAASADPMGALRGLFGRRSDGSSVLFGKQVDERGAFAGRLRGTYGEGAFEAAWENARGEAEGALRGRYLEGAGGEDGEGLFVGSWSRRCRDGAPAAAGEDASAAAPE